MKIPLETARGKTPLELLNSQDDWHKSIFHDLWLPVSCGVIGIGGSLYVNFGWERPYKASLPRTLLYGVLGYGIGYFVNERREAHYAKKDAIIRHYVELHPEDFVTPARKKWGDILEKWEPIR